MENKACSETVQYVQCFKCSVKKNMDPYEFYLASIRPVVTVCQPHVLLHCVCCCGAAVLHSVLLSSDRHVGLECGLHAAGVFEGTFGVHSRKE